MKHDSQLTHANELYSGVYYNDPRDSFGRANTTHRDSEIPDDGDYFAHRTTTNEPLVKRKKNSKSQADFKKKPPLRITLESCAHSVQCNKHKTKASTIHGGCPGLRRHRLFRGLIRLSCFQVLALVPSLFFHHLSSSWLIFPF